MQINASSSTVCKYCCQQHDTQLSLSPALCYSCVSEELLIISPLPSVVQILPLEHILKKLQIKQFPNRCVSGFLLL